MSDPKRPVVPEFACAGLMPTVPGDDGCTCYGCRANRATREAVVREREETLRLLRLLRDEHSPTAEWARGIQDAIGCLERRAATLE